MQYGLIGEHLPHSFSREVHEKIGGYRYELKELTPEAVGPFMQAHDFCAINVTIPYKQTVIPYLDTIDEHAAAIGAVNTVVNRDGRLLGYNTDFVGMRDCLAHYGIVLQDACVLILGTGGTARTARAVARAAGAREILVAGRRGGEGVITYDEAYRRAEDVDCILNTTPVGMYPTPDACPIDLSRFPRVRGVFDAIYNPARTDLILDARARGLAAGGGLYMLVSQAVAAAAIFRGIDPTPALTEEIYRAVRAEKENIVLIGMPGSGKSTVGRILAAALGRPFRDSDEEIVKEAGCPIPALFEREGEEGFRARERAAVARLSLTGGCVIATGGGAVLKEENLRALRRTGRLYFLDRRLDDICPTDDRPLSRDRAALQKRYAERYPIYTAASDRRIAVTTDAQGVAEEIRTDFLAWGGLSTQQEN